MWQAMTIYTFIDWIHINNFHSCVLVCCTRTSHMHPHEPTHMCCSLLRSCVINLWTRDNTTCLQLRTCCTLYCEWQWQVSASYLSKFFSFKLSIFFCFRKSAQQILCATGATQTMLSISVFEIIFIVISFNCPKYSSLKIHMCVRRAYRSTTAMAHVRYPVTELPTIQPNKWIIWIDGTENHFKNWKISKSTSSRESEEDRRCQGLRALFEVPVRMFVGSNHIIIYKIQRSS